MKASLIRNFQIYVLCVKLKSNNLHNILFCFVTYQSIYGTKLFKYMAEYWALPCDLNLLNYI